jgi:LemA protein
MSTALIIVLVIVGLIILIYNNLNASKNRVEKSFSNIDVYLEERFDKISALLEQTLTAYDHEEKVYTEVSALRSGITNAKNGGINEKVKAENQISDFMASPLLKTEAYRELKSIKDLGVLTANETIKSEANLSAARRQYNNNATSYNTSLTAFPTNIIANIFGFNTPYELFKVTEGKKERPMSASAEYLNKKFENRQ